MSDDENDDLFSRMQKRRKAEEEARLARDEGMERAEANADPDWKELMFRIVWRLAHQMAQFTADDAMDVYDEMPEPKPHTHDRRAFGPVMNRAAREGLVLKSDRVIPSRRRSLHACPRQIWISLVFQGKAA